ncbi:AraC family transcriptional regulator [Caballeronia cordobensis]|uniref:AraC family transcriptional regulator n=1 Tax=Caballeronia cordobensis TaxID=1353886 RepID=A0A158I0F6_CABCO|nr:AraC family transcriptional regulator [Caballeronia cordobensis]SAL50036.1 AraC family transcriptional regulator [Caballeronia cordobensis]
MDLLTGVLSLVPITGSLDSRCHFGGAWKIERPTAEPRVIHYYVMLTGKAWLDIPAGDALELSPGDIVFFPGGDAHRLHGGSGHLLGSSATRRSSHLLAAADLPPTDVLCGRIFLHGPCPQLLLRHLPGRLVINSKDAKSKDPQASVVGSHLYQLAELLRDEAIAQDPRSATTLSHMAVALFGMTLRLGSMVDDAPKGLLALLGSRQLRPALAALFDQPQANWTLLGLAKLCSLSRATFVRHFDRACGRSAIDLLTEVRMTIAGVKLESTRLPVSDVGKAVGYQSTAAFQRAFKSHSGITPARWRLQARNPAAG